MPIRVQSLRSSTKNTRPAAGSREPGEIYTNFPDLQLGVIDASKNPKDLIAVRFFSATTNYAVGDFVVNAGVGYRAKEVIVAGAFNAAQWDTINVSGSAEPPIAAGTVSQYWRGDKNWATLDKAAVGLGAVDNTSDANKPISSAEQAALNLKANIASPTFTGDPKAPTPSAGDNDTSIATTAFVAASFAPITSPNFGGDPRAPTPATADNDTSIATTAYVKANLATYAPLASPVFTGTPTAPTPSPGDSDTSLATTAFVQAEIGNRPLDAPADGNYYGRRNNGWADVTEEAPADGVSYGRKNGSWVASVGGAVISDMPPPGPLTPGQLWWESDSGNTFLWFDDGTSQQWVQQNIQPGSAELPGALVSAEADMSWRFKPAETPAGYPNRTVLNDKADGTGNDKVFIDDRGNINIHGSNGGNFSWNGFIDTAGPAWRAALAGYVGVLAFDKSTGALSFYNTAATNAADAGITMQTALSIDKTGRVTAGGAVVAAQDFISTSANLCLNTTGAGTVFLRPNGQNVPTGQAQVNNLGTMNVALDIGAGRDIYATGGVQANGTVFAGTNQITLRPNGINNATGQCLIDTGGTLSVANALGVAGIIQGLGYKCRGGTGGGFGANNYNLLWTGAMQLWVDGTNTGNITVTSDYRTKKDVADLGSTWDVVKALRPISYTQAEFTSPAQMEANEKAQEEGGTKEVPPPLFPADDFERWGFIAHELQETLVPSAANGEKDSHDTVQSLNLAVVVAALTKALQEAMARIEALEAASGV